MTSVLNWWKRTFSGWFVLGWPYLVDGTLRYKNQLTIRPRPSHRFSRFYRKVTGVQARLTSFPWMFPTYLTLGLSVTGSRGLWPITRTHKSAPAYRHGHHRHPYHLHTDMVIIVIPITCIQKWSSSSSLSPAYRHDDHRHPYHQHRLNSTHRWFRNIKQHHHQRHIVVVVIVRILFLLTISATITGP